MEASRYTSLGGYPTFFTVSWGGGHVEARCYDCTEELENNEDEMEAVEAIDAHINWESIITCEECHCDIETAYGVSDEQHDEFYAVGYTQHTSDIGETVCADCRIDHNRSVYAQECIIPSVVATQMATKRTEGCAYCAEID